MARNWRTNKIFFLFLYLFRSLAKPALANLRFGGPTGSDEELIGMQYEGKLKMLIKGKSCFLNNSGQQDLILENPRLHYYLEVTSSRIVTL